MLCFYSLSGISNCTEFFNLNSLKTEPKAKMKVLSLHLGDTDLGSEDEEGNAKQ